MSLIWIKNIETIEVETENQLLMEGTTTKYAKYIHGIQKVYNNISASLQTVVKEGSFPLLISGAHSTAGGTIKGLAEAYPNKRIGVVWIDAHADIHSPYTTPSGNVHGMPLATALKLDNDRFQLDNRNIDNETVKVWSEICGETPRVKTEDVVYFAVRDTEREEDEIIGIASRGLNNFNSYASMLGKIELNIPAGFISVIFYAALLKEQDLHIHNIGTSGTNEQTFFSKIDHDFIVDKWGQLSKQSPVDLDRLAKALAKNSISEFFDAIDTMRFSPTHKDNKLLRAAHSVRAIFTDRPNTTTSGSDRSKAREESINAIHINEFKNVLIIFGLVIHYFRIVNLQFFGAFRHKKAIQIFNKVHF